jgi:hypothetical protein
MKRLAVPGSAPLAPAPPDRSADGGAATAPAFIRGYHAPSEMRSIQTLGKGGPNHPRSSRGTSLGCALTFALLAACQERTENSAPRKGAIEAEPLAAPNSRAGTLFELLPAERTGIAFENRFEWGHPLERLYPHGYAGGGVCAGDYDGDGLPDLFLTSQTGQDRLFRQVGELRFEDATQRAGILPESGWGTGCAFADADGDGDLDLYVCNYDAPNRLYVNQGGGSFRERAKELGVDFRGASVMAAFADYDADGDLDLHLLTNRLYPPPGEDRPETRIAEGEATVAEGQEELFAIQERRIGGELQRYVVKAGQRDRLYRNDGKGFTDVTVEAGLAANEPGLSATWWDYDHDGLPDLYVANDFWDPDHLYHNEGGGRFVDVLPSALPHTPWFSMGADFADVDGDGRVDFLAADMAPTTHFMSKLMMGDMNESRWFLESAEPRQYMRNALYLNTGTPRFLEAAFLAGVASTDWTWSVKFGDLDCDGRPDLFVTNGTANHSFDPDLTRELRALEEEQARRGLDPAAAWAEQWSLYRKVPPRRERNLALRNGGDLHFEDATQAWGLGLEGISFGAALADLDRDGDLDLVVSNVGDPVSIYRNGTASQRLAVRLEGTLSNRWGIGSIVALETPAGRQVQELYATRGYMSANEPLLHFGLGGERNVRELSVRWPSGHDQVFRDLAAGYLYTITEPSVREPSSSESTARPHGALPSPQPELREVALERGFDSGARPERPYDDYRREPLLPAKLSTPGPGLAWGDADGDGRDDLYVGGSAGQSGQLLLAQADGRFRAAAEGAWAADRDCEDTAALWLDADGDGDLDLYVASGGAECEPGDPMLRDRLYLAQGGGRFERAPAGSLPRVYDSTGALAAADFDRDGDLDLFVGARSVPGRYPETPISRLLRNDGGSFADATAELAPGLEQVGLVSAALASDADGDGWIDLMVALDWGPIAYWRNAGGRLADHTASAGLADRTGWWTALAGADLDGDGDIDYVALNAGLNTKYKATNEEPALLYYGAFDASGRKELIEAKAGAEGLLPVRGLSCSSSAMPFIKEKLPTYHEFASAKLAEIYEPSALERAQVFRANTLESGVLVNERGADGSVRFGWQPLPRLAQVSQGQGVVAADLDGDGACDVALLHNFFDREPETGRWDGGLGLVLRGDGRGGLEPVPPAVSGFVAPGDARALTVCDADGDGRPELVASRNGERLLFFAPARPSRAERAALCIRLRGRPGNPTCVGARVTLELPDGLGEPGQLGELGGRVGLGARGGRRHALEVYAGSGYLSQSTAALFFGRGSEREPLTVRVRWPDGRESSHEAPPGVAVLELVEPQE